MSLLLLLGLLSPLEQDYASGDYEAVLANASTVLSQVGVSRADSNRVYELQAFSLVALGQIEEAEEVFRMLLARNPDLQLDSRQVSPKIVAVLDRVRDKMTREARLLGPDSSLALSGGAQGHRTSQLSKAHKPIPISAIVPGLPQLRAKQRTKALALAGGEMIALVGSA
ncbi:MAG: hypothetical protein ABIK62_05310, partial [candidate division WOR-3 bacterium]